MADRPTPTVSADQWLADPDGSEEASMEVVRVLFDAAQDIGWGWLAPIALVVWTLGRTLLPGWGAAIGDAAFKLLAPKQTVQQDKLTYAISGGSLKLLELAQDVPAVRMYLEEQLDEDGILDLHHALKELRDAKKAAP